MKTLAADAICFSGLAVLAAGCPGDDVAGRPAVSESCLQDCLDTAEAGEIDYESTFSEGSEKYCRCLNTVYSELEICVLDCMIEAFEQVDTVEQ